MYINQCCLVIPSKKTSIGDWLELIKQMPESALPAKLTSKIFMNAGIDYKEFVRGDRVLTLTRSLQAKKFSDAGSAFQSQLAEQAILQLTDCLDDQDWLNKLGLLIYGHTSIDEQIYRSSVNYLAGKLGIKKAMAFSVGQNQALSFFQSLNISNSFFASENKIKDALYVCAEKWPLPFPRVMANGHLLSDAAAAVKLSKTACGSSLKYLSSSVISREFGSTSYNLSSSNIIKYQELVQELITLAETTISEARANLSDISFIGTTGVDKVLDELLITRLSESSKCQIIETEYADGYFMSVQPMIILSKVMSLINQNNSDIKEGSLCLLFGVGLDFGIGCALFRVSLNSNTKLTD